MLITEPWHLYLAYTGQAVAFGLSGAIAINALMSRWFVTRRAWAMSITFTGISLGGMVLAPVGTWLVGRGGVDLAAPILAAILLVVALPVSLFVLVGDPRRLGSKPMPAHPTKRLRTTRSATTCNCDRGPEARPCGPDRSGRCRLVS